MIRTVRLIAKSLVRKIWSPTNVDRLDCIVVSPGGVATTTLTEHISLFLSTNSAFDLDQLKHRPFPPKIREETVRFILVTGNSDQIISSLKRRNYFQYLSAKLGSIIGVIGISGWSERAFARAQLKQEVAWKRDARTLAVKFDDIWSSQKMIADHLSITDPRFFSDFPERKNRLSGAKETKG